MHRQGFQTISHTISHLHILLESIKKNIDFLKNMKMRNRVADGLKTLAVHLLENQELAKLKELTKVAPYWFRDLPEYKELEAGVTTYTKDIKDAPMLVED